MAALEVVHKRLEEVHLSDFCLALHSHKANKKAFIEELNNNELCRLFVDKQNDEIISFGIFLPPEVIVIEYTKELYHYFINKATKIDENPIIGYPKPITQSIPIPLTN